MGKKRLRVLSANLWNDGADAAGFAQLVEELQPDVVAMQELGKAQADAVAAVMPHGRLEPAERYMGMGIAVRHSSCRVEWLSLPYRGALVAELHLGPEDDGGTIEIINVHVRAPHDPRAYFAGIRQGQLRGLIRHIEQTPDRRRIVLGDFNATPSWPVYRHVAARMTDAAIDAARKNGGRTAPTWGPWPGSRRLLRIDHVFVNGLSAEHFRVVPVAGGDHSAVVADLTLTGLGG